jgi:hypothetical protein
MSPVKIAALGLLVAMAGACDSSDDPDSLPACQGNVTMTVGSGTTPTFSWVPRCRVTTIVVDPNSDFIDTWALRAKGETNALPPPVQYGASPDGTITTVGPGPLQAGTQYRVRVLRATGDESFPFEVIGGTFFTP